MRWYAGSVAAGVLVALAVAPMTVRAEAFTRAGQPIRVQSVSTGTHGSCAVLDGGVLTCWGSRSIIGDSTLVDRAAPVRVSGGALSGHAVTSVSVAFWENFACAVLDDASVACWGDDFGGQMGDGQADQVSRLTPELVSGDELSGRAVTSVSGGSLENFACAVLEAGSLACWGGGWIFYPDSPVRESGGALSGRSVVSVSVGRSHACAVLDNGALACWGANCCGQLGYGWFGFEENTPRLVSGGALSGRSVVSVSAGGSHTCAVLDNGALACWGNNNYGQVGYGQLGYGIGADRLSPVLVSGGALSGRSVVSVSAGEDRTCAVLDNGALACWGANFRGELGDGTRTNRLSPVLVSGGALSGRSVVSVSVAENNTCAVLDNGALACWGDNEFGAVGDGTYTDRRLPVLVDFDSPPETPVDVKAYTLAGSAGVQVRWTQAESFTPILGFVVSVSLNGGRTWTEHELGTDRLAYVVPELRDPARAGLIRVAAVNAAGRGEWSTPVLGVSRGFRSMRVSVVDSVGHPVIGGAISWTLRDTAGDVIARSAVPYGLTDDGVIEFPAAPAGRMSFTLSNALTESGATVSGTFNEVLGFTQTVLRLPAAPVSRRVVRVVIPGNSGMLPVSGVALTVDPGAGQYQDQDCLAWFDGSMDSDDYCLEYADPSVTGGLAFATTVDGFRFRVPQVPTGIITDAAGRGEIVGFFAGQPRVTVEYDDKVIVQTQRVVLRNTESVVELDSMPWLEVADSLVAANLGTLVPLTVSVRSMQAMVTRDPAVMTRAGLPAVGAGVRVTVIRPEGAVRGTCGAVETAKTNAQGKATLKVCATKSGEYRFSTAGAAAVSSVMVHVRGAAPLPPTAVTVRSLTVGTARITWNAPAYTGGATVTGYIIKATAKGKKPVTKIVAAKARTAILTGLSNATTYSVTIAARTKNGTSDDITTLVPVA